MSGNYGQSPLKNLLHNYGKYHKHTVLQPGKKVKLPCITMMRMCLPPDIISLPTTQSSKSMTYLDGKTAAEYSKETTTQRDLVQLQEHCE